MRALLRDTTLPAETTPLSARAPDSGRYRLRYIRSRVARNVNGTSQSVLKQRQGTGCCSTIIYQYTVVLCYNVTGNGGYDGKT